MTVQMISICLYKNNKLKKNQKQESYLKGLSFSKTVPYTTKFRGLCIPFYTKEFANLIKSQ